MKDYTLDKKEKETFILNYEIFNKSSEIIVHFATGEDYIIPYTKENEKKLLDKMTKQVKESSTFEEAAITRIQSFKELKLPAVILGTLFLPAMVLITSQLHVPTASWIVMGGWVTAGASILTNMSIKVKTLQNKLKDLAKNKKFLENEREITEALAEEKDRVHQNTLSNLSLKADKQIFNAVSKNRPAIDINTVDSIKESDLEQILDNINRNKTFGFDYTNAKMLTKKRTRKIKK